MFGSKAKELQATLEQREKEIKELNERLEQYKSRNEAVVNALTDAKAAASRIVAEAEKQRDEIAAAVEQERQRVLANKENIIREAEERAKGIVANAEENARGIVAKAEGSANNLRQQADAKVREAESKAQYFKKYIKDTAETVRKQAENYAAFLSDYQTAGIGAPLGQDVPALPEDYANPAELMHSIFAIQGREMPNEGDENNESNETAAVQSPAEKPAEKAEPEIDTISAQEPREDKIWTVDEVLKSTEEAGSEIDAQLNDIINDILKLD